MWLLVAGLLVLHFALAVGSKFHQSTTSDEMPHLTAGFSYWKNHDYRLHPENGNLPQRWAALPAWLGGTKFPPLEDNPYWRVSDVWKTGYLFFYGSSQDHFPRLMAGRAMIALFSVATGLLVFCWSRRFFGDVGGLISLTFLVFCPNFLAHGALVTSDVCMTFFFLAAVGAWWRHLHNASNRTFLLSALVFGLAQVAKYSGVLLVPMMAVMVLVRVFAPAPWVWFGRTLRTRWEKFGGATLSLAGHAGVSLLVIWAFYGFRYSAFNPALPPALQFIRTWEFFESRLGTTGEIIHWVRMKELLPEGYLYGFAYVLETVKSRSAFLNGEYSETGWPSFFLWTFGLKTTLALIAAAVITAGLGFLHGWRSRSGSEPRYKWLYPAIPLLTLFVIYWITSLTSQLNIGHRHILPIYPVLFIGVGALGAWSASGRIRAIIVAALLLWHVSAAIRITPYFLAYFNEIAGGPKKGRHHLVDSSLDWGQDLPALKDWLKKNNPANAPVFLSYFGSAEPAYYDLKVKRLPFVNLLDFEQSYFPLEAGIYCISATALAQVYSPTRGKWTAENEQKFRELHNLESTFAQYASDPKIREELQREVASQQWEMVIRHHNLLRFARLAQYLRVREPDGYAGYSIMIYRLSAEEISRAVNGSLSDWSSAIEEAAQARQR